MISEPSQTIRIPSMQVVTVIVFSASGEGRSTNARKNGSKYACKRRRVPYFWLHRIKTFRGRGLHVSLRNESHRWALTGMMQHGFKGFSPTSEGRNLAPPEIERHHGIYFWCFGGEFGSFFYFLPTVVRKRAPFLKGLNRHWFLSCSIIQSDSL